MRHRAEADRLGAAPAADITDGFSEMEQGKGRVRIVSINANKSDHINIQLLITDLWQHYGRKVVMAIQETEFSNVKATCAEGFALVIEGARSALLVPNCFGHGLSDFGGRWKNAHVYQNCSMSVMCPVICHKSVEELRSIWVKFLS